MTKILVIGSINVDLVSRVPHLPKEGETITSRSFNTFYGGKGANQVVAAARLGADVAMIGKVGNDVYGPALIEHFRQAGVDTTGIQIVPGPTGMAFINVSDQGENNIVLVPGANYELGTADIDRHSELIEQCEMIIMQLEIPLSVVEYVVEKAHRFNKKVILNPAPAQPLSEQLLSRADTLIPNEMELMLLTGMPVTTDEDMIRAARKLKSLGVRRVIVTAGERGSFVITYEAVHHVPAFKVEAVDTTAAGDSYIAAFVYGTTRGMSDVEAATFASKVSAVVVTRKGAQTSLPTLGEVEAFFKSAPHG